MGYRLEMYPGVALAYSRELAERLVETTIVNIATDARVLAPVKTGRLKASLKSSIGGTKYVVKGTVGSTLSYAAAQEEGAAPHIIRPHRKFLKFYWEKVGQTVYLRSVNHPGAPATAYLMVPLETWGRVGGFQVTHFIGGTDNA